MKKLMRRFLTLIVTTNLLAVVSSTQVTEPLRGNVTFVAPNAVTVDTEGNVYAVCGGSTNVFKITPAGVIDEIIDRSAAGAPGELFGANGVALDSAGNVYVTGTISDNVYKVEPGGTITRILDSVNGLEEPYGIAVDASDNVFVAGRASDNVLRVTPLGAVAQIIGPAGSVRVVLEADRGVAPRRPSTVATSVSSNAASARTSGTATTSCTRLSTQSWATSTS